MKGSKCFQNSMACWNSLSANIQKQICVISSFMVKSLKSKTSICTTSTFSSVCKDLFSKQKECISMRTINHVQAVPQLSNADSTASHNAELVFHLLIPPTVYTLVYNLYDISIYAYALVSVSGTVTNKCHWGPTFYLYHGNNFNKLHFSC